MLVQRTIQFTFNKNNNTTSNTRIYIDANGRIGFNTTGPNYPIDIVGQTEIVRPNYNGTTVTEALVLYSGQNASSGGGAAIRFDHSYGGMGQTRGAVIHSIDETGSSYGQNVSLVFKTGITTLTEYMRISGAGNVGIGNSNPQFKLDLNGTFNKIQANEALYSGSTTRGSTVTSCVIYTTEVSASSFITRTSEAANGDTFTVTTTGYYMINSYSYVGGNYAIGIYKAAANTSAITPATNPAYSADRLLYAFCLQWETTLSGVFYFVAGQKFKVYASSNLTASASLRFEFRLCYLNWSLMIYYLW
jgi:hypothetical protein